MKQQDFETALYEAAVTHSHTHNYKGEVQRDSFIRGGQWSRAWVLRNDPVVLNLVRTIRSLRDEMNRINLDGNYAALADYEKEIKGL
jgi:hypothetical protein